MGPGSQDVRVRASPASPAPPRTSSAPLSAFSLLPPSEFCCSRLWQLSGPAETCSSCYRCDLLTPGNGLSQDLKVLLEPFLEPFSFMGDELSCRRSERVTLICSIAQVGATWQSDLVSPRLGHTLVHQTSSSPSCFQKTNLEGKTGHLLPPWRAHLSH